MSPMNGTAPKSFTRKGKELFRSARKRGLIDVPRALFSSLTSIFCSRETPHSQNGACFEATRGTALALSLFPCQPRFIMDGP